MAKCDTCKNEKDEIHQYSDGYRILFCNKGHWYGEGSPETIAPEGLWDDCKDYEQKELIVKE